VWAGRVGNWRSGLGFAYLFMSLSSDRGIGRGSHLDLGLGRGQIFIIDK